MHKFSIDRVSGGASSTCNNPRCRKLAKLLDGKEEVKSGTALQCQHSSSNLARETSSVATSTNEDPLEC